MSKEKETPVELRNSVIIEENDEKRIVRVSALPGKSWIKLDEWQVNVLAEGLSKIVQKWERAS